MHQMKRFTEFAELNAWLKDNQSKIRVKDIKVVVHGSFALFFVHYTLPDQELPE